MTAIKHNGTMISVEMLPNTKKPSLCVHFDGEIVIYKVATFRDEKTAKWFVEVMEEFFKDIVGDSNDS